MIYLFILHAIQFPKNYGTFVYNILKIICRGETGEIYLVFDVYGTPTVRDTEQEIRCGKTLLNEMTVSGPGQKTSKKPLVVLRNDSFKISLISVQRMEKYCHCTG